MKLLLSSDALPGGSLDDLARAYRRRALEGLELSADDAFGAPSVGESELTVRWVKLPRGASPAAVTAAVTLAARFGAGLLTHAPLTAPLPHVPLALLHETERAAAKQASAWARYHGVQTAWEIEPGAFNAETAAAVLEETWPTLAHVRLLGAGPENDANEGLGSLMTRLALDSYGGTLALAPSRGADLNVWAAWLFETRGWGCGSAAQKRGLTRDVHILQ